MNNYYRIIMNKLYNIILDMLLILIEKSYNI